MTDKYEEVKEIILRYIETKADYEGIPMDVGAMNEEAVQSDEEL
jgi:hypothetical protein